MKINLLVSGWLWWYFRRSARQTFWSRSASLKSPFVWLRTNRVRSWEQFHLILFQKLSERDIEQ